MSERQEHDRYATGQAPGRPPDQAEGNRETVEQTLRDKERRGA